MKLGLMYDAGKNPDGYIVQLDFIAEGGTVTIVPLFKLVKEGIDPCDPPITEIARDIIKKYNALKELGL